MKASIFFILILISSLSLAQNFTKNDYIGTWSSPFNCSTCNIKIKSKGDSLILHMYDWGEDRRDLGQYPITIVESEKKYDFFIKRKSLYGEDIYCRYKLLDSDYATGLEENFECPHPLIRKGVPVSQFPNTQLENELANRSWQSEDAFYNYKIELGPNLTGVYYRTALKLDEASQAMNREIEIELITAKENNFVAITNKTGTWTCAFYVKEDLMLIGKSIGISNCTSNDFYPIRSTY